MTPVNQSAARLEHLRAAQRMQRAEQAIRWLNNLAFRNNMTPLKARTIGDWERVKADAAPLCFPAMKGARS